MTASATSPPARSRRRISPIRAAIALAGLGLIIAGLVVLLGPILEVWQHARADSAALQQWKHGGSSALVGAAPGSEQADSLSNCAPSTSPSDNYALVSFPSLGYSGVAGNGDWNVLHQRSMVHYSDTAAPGQKGNVIIAFHREPNYENVDHLAVNDVVTVQDRGCHTYTYRITNRWVIHPQDVTQLVPTDGHDLTLITCTPWWRDYDRIVWRASLVA